MDQKTILITGATAGFGEAIARLLSDKGYDLILTGRREDRLNKLRDELLQKGVNITTHTFDVREREEVERHLSGLQVDVLINNAGLAVGLSHLADGEPEDWDRMIDTNLKGLLYVTKAVLPGMKERKSGQVINVGSIAGKEVYPGGNVYCATKHAVDALTRAMRMELYEFGIRVGSISPGAAETEFSLVRFKGDMDKAKQVYQGFIPLNAADIANAVYFMISSPSHVNVADIVLLPAAQGAASLIKRSKS